MITSFKGFFEYIIYFLNYISIISLILKNFPVPTSIIPSNSEVFSKYAYILDIINMYEVR